LDVKSADIGLLQSRYRLTKQRAAVLQALGDGGHLAAEEIHRRVKAELPDLSLGTVYRTLEILREIGLVQAFTYGADAARYEASLEKHHHLLCSACRLVVNVTAPDLARVAHDLAAEEGFAEIDYSMTIVGRCPECASGAHDVSRN
jgi:Fe2+ or Zn2+ uptake regulation protein